MKQPLKQRILAFLRQNDARWVSGIELEANASLWGYKASTISRRCRELAQDGQIIRNKGLYAEYKALVRIINIPVLVNKNTVRLERVTQYNLWDGEKSN